MTPDDARNYFFQHLPLVRNSSELLRLTLWTLPHLSPAPDRPLGAMQTMAFRVKLDYLDDKIHVWYCSNRDVSAQLRTLEPIYSRGSSSPSFCSGLSPVVRVPNGPSLRAPGLGLGVFAREHEAVRKKLHSADSMQAWWGIFLEHTPLWMRTAYNWYQPTAEQRVVLREAKKAMLAYAQELTECTKFRYSNRTGTVQARFEHPYSRDNDHTSQAPHWNALRAGQHFLNINDVQEYRIEFDGFNNGAPGVFEAVKGICMATCAMRGWDDMGDYHVAQAIQKSQESKRTLREAKGIDFSQVMG